MMPRSWVRSPYRPLFFSLGPSALLVSKVTDGLLAKPPADLAEMAVPDGRRTVYGDQSPLRFNLSLANQAGGSIIQ